ncbi:unnamed protein product [Victoria cruziana]
MDRFRPGLRSLLPENASISQPSYSSGGSYVVARSSSGKTLSLATCSKACALSFIIGVFVGFTLKRRVRRWAAKMLKKWKDD